MGKGIAVEFRRRWPDMYDRYRELCQADQFRPGDVFTCAAPDRTVFNLGTQRTWRTKATLSAVDSAARAMLREADRVGVKAIAMPRIAAGLGGLEWDDVRRVLSEAAEGDIEIVVYTPAS